MRYGEPLWHLIYQADCRMRKEQMERLRRRGAEAKSKDPQHEFDTSTPWKWVWSEANSDHAFWKDQLEDPAMMVLTKTRSVHAVVDVDAQVGGGVVDRRKQPKIEQLRNNTPPLRGQL